MGLVAPLALALGLLAIPLVLLYLLKPRRDEMRVSSTFLWRQAMEEMQANAPWQRLRRNLLLLLQLILLALLVFALARPLVHASNVPGGDVVILLDDSGSMAATDVSPSRFAESRDKVRSIVNDLAPGRSAALITTGQSPRLVAGPTSDRGKILQALDSLKEPHGESNLRDAVVLGKAIAGQMKEPTIVLVGDGGAVTSDVPTVPYPVRFDPVRGDGDNAAILSVSARQGATGRQLWVSVGNWGGQRTARLEISVDGRLYDARDISLPANAVTGVTENDMPPGSVIQARLNTQDSIAADNSGWYVDTQGPPAKVLVYGDPSRFLERALSLLNGIEVSTLPAGKDVKPGYDVYVFNGTLPDKLPDSGSLLLLGPSDSKLLPVRGEEKYLRVTTQQDDSLLLRYVNLSNVSIARAARMQPPDWMETLASSGDVPILVAGEHDGRKVAALAFSPEDSDLPLQVAFPILISNLMNYLRPQPAVPEGGAVSPGETVQLPATSDNPNAEYAVTAPDGKRTVMKAGEAAPVFANTLTPGVYTVASGRDGKLLGRFVVNAGSADESNVTAFNSDPLRSEGKAEGTDDAGGGREFWWVVVVAALLVILFEWWLYTRPGVRTWLRGRRAS